MREITSRQHDGFHLKTLSSDNRSRGPKDSICDIHVMKKRSLQGLKKPLTLTENWPEIESEWRSLKLGRLSLNHLILSSCVMLRGVCSKLGTFLNGFDPKLETFFNGFNPKLGTFFNGFDPKLLLIADDT